MRHLIDKLIGKNLRFHIGNRDELVGTAACFSFIEQLAEASYQNRIRSPQAELIVYPAIGYLGHGTPKAIFEQGAEWLSQKLEAVDG
jgi:esterase FrsA